MISQPLVSIVTSVYNHEKHLDDYFNGLLSQTYRNVQLIIYDDGSTDRSWAKVEAYRPRLEMLFPQVVCASHQNIGFHRELDCAMNEVAGELLCIIASDDYYLPNAISDMVSFLSENNDYGVVHGEADYVYPDHVEEKHWAASGVQIPTGEIFSELIIRNFILPCTACIRSGLVKGKIYFSKYLARGYFMEDHPMYLELSRQTKIGFIPKSLARYRVSQETLSRSKNDRKQYEFYNSSYQVRLDFMEKYGAAIAQKRLLLFLYHKFLYEWGVRLCDATLALKGFGWLIENGFSEFRTLWHYSRAYSTKVRILWRLNNWLQRKEVLFRIRQLLLKPSSRRCGA